MANKINPINIIAVISAPLKINPEDIQKIRKKFGFGKSEFARAMGVNAVSVWEWENDRAEPSGSARMLLYYLKTGRLNIKPQEFRLKRGRNPKDRKHKKE